MKRARDAADWTIDLFISIGIIIHELCTTNFTHREEWAVVMENGIRRNFKSFEKARRFARHRAIYCSGAFSLDVEESERKIVMRHKATQ